MRRIHYFSGIVLSIFIGMHLCNHAWGILGIDRHIALMDSFRAIYRNTIGELLLLAAVLAQAITGLGLVRKLRGTPKTTWDKLHIGSGLYLAFFLLLHTSAVLMGRIVLHLDTNFYFGAAGINTFPLSLFFVPYYILAVMSMATHIASVHRKKVSRNLLGLSPQRQAVGIVLVGAIITFIVFWGMTQGFQGVDVPAAYEILQGK
jgi:hypothetical protein